MVYFTQEPQPNNTIKITWKAPTSDAFRQTVDLIKMSIPKTGRRYDPEARAWFVAVEYADRLKDIETAMSSEDKARPVEDEQAEKDGFAARLAFRKIPSLGSPFYGRAMYAAKVVLRMIEAPFEYCVSRQEFGAWSEEDEVWYYTDGRYSASSPVALDEKERKAAMHWAECEVRMNKRADEAWIEIEGKAALRAQMLEKYEHRCYVCLKQPPAERGLHMHRVIPGKDGGMYVESNIVLLCSRCHRKHEGKPWEFFHEQRQRTTRGVQ